MRAGGRAGGRVGERVESRLTRQRQGCLVNGQVDRHICGRADESAELRKE